MYSLGTFLSENVSASHLTSSDTILLSPWFTAYRKMYANAITEIGFRETVGSNCSQQYDMTFNGENRKHLTKGRPDKVNKGIIIDLNNSAEGYGM